MQSLCSSFQQNTVEWEPVVTGRHSDTKHWHGDSYLSPFREITSCAPSEIFEHTLQCEHLGQNQCHHHHYSNTEISEKEKKKKKLLPFYFGRTYKEVH